MKMIQIYDTGAKAVIEIGGDFVQIKPGKVIAEEIADLETMRKHFPHEKPINIVVNKQK